MKPVWRCEGVSFQIELEPVMLRADQQSNARALTPEIKQFVTIRLPVAGAEHAKGPSVSQGCAASARARASAACVIDLGKSHVSLAVAADRISNGPTSTVRTRIVPAGWVSRKTGSGAPATATHRQRRRQLFRKSPRAPMRQLATSTVTATRNSNCSTGCWPLG